LQACGLDVHKKPRYPSGYVYPAGGPDPVGLGLCQRLMWCAGPVEMEGGTLSDRLGDLQNILH
jgi:hypothetical protein